MEEDDEEEKDGASKVAEPGSKPLDIVSFKSAAINPTVEPSSGPNGTGVGGEGRVDVGVEYGGLCTICRLKHS